MQKIAPTVLLLAAGFWLAPAMGALAGSGGHDHGANHVELRLNNGKKWPTDDALRRGMGEIRTLMGRALPDIHHGRYDSARYAKLASGLSGWIDYLTANCKLEPEADAQLHVVLEQIIDGAARMESGVQPVEGAVKVLTAIDLYGRHFDHPGWRPLDH